LPGLLVFDKHHLDYIIHIHILPYDVYGLMIYMTSLLSHSIQINGDKLI